MVLNPRTQALVNRSLAEYRIRKHFKTKRKDKLSPTQLLLHLTIPKNGRKIKLKEKERFEFLNMIRRMARTQKTLEKYRNIYSKRPRIFYEKALGFAPRENQSVKVVWNPLSVHILFEKNDMMAFWRKVQWGPGSGGYYPLGDTDIKIKDLRGMVSLGRKEDFSIETWDTMRHESVHAFEGNIKKRNFPKNRKNYMFCRIKSELNAYLHNFRYTKDKKRKRVNKWARNGLAIEVREFIEEYLGFEDIEKSIKTTKSKIRASKNKREKKILRQSLEKLKKQLETKKAKKKHYFGMYRKISNQIKIALQIMPLEAVQRIIFETPFERLQKKLPESVTIYKKMLYLWKNN
ncbi:MAG: hypothetical protein JW700_01670 [Candidatus Aenigmarchaeota archaeon]|nr:hypothetical protein [Candidatus Aenigmarchaeota archaeon]